ncbi:MAG: methyltransferase domain-containing protein [Acidimicrobiales bacterium]|nr:methyltransferase domain-containing protein [Acidimicrobiales bacterium]
MPDDRYTHGHHDAVLRSHRWRTAENSAAYLTPLLGPGMSLLDVGCGPGNLTLDLASVVAPGPVVGLDRSADVLAEASARLGGDSTVEFRTGDVYDLPFPDDSFDVVHAHQVLQHLSDPVAALREMYRVARPGGLVAARDADYAAMTWHPSDARLDRWMEIYQAVARSNEAEPNAGRQLLAWAHAAGLDDVSATASVWCFADNDSRLWWGGLWAERSTSSALAAQAIELGVDAAELARIAGGFDDWAADRDAWFIVPHGEIVVRVT